MITNLYIGNTSNAFSKHVKQIDPDAVLITEHNMLTVGNISTAYTCIGDLGPSAWTSKFKQLLDLSTNITYVSTDVDTGDELTDNDHTKLLLENYRITTSRTVAGLEDVVDQYTASFLNLHSKRKTDSKQIWVVGCSNTNGIGYVDVGERYGDLLSAELNLPATFLAKNGSSIEWAADQILRSDIRPGDVVFWGITHNSRLTYHSRHALLHINPWHLVDEIPVDRLDDFDRLHHNVKSIYQVVHQCQAQNIHLFMLDILPNPILKPFLYQLNNYDVGVDYYGKFVDFGKDGEHAGPKQHEIFAKKFLNMYNNL